MHSALATNGQLALADHGDHCQQRKNRPVLSIPKDEWTSKIRNTDTGKVTTLCYA